jgi:hypothetical protein
MDKQQPNEDQRINNQAPRPPKTKAKHPNQDQRRALNQPRPEIVEACLQGSQTNATNKTKPITSAPSSKASFLGTQVGGNKGDTKHSRNERTKFTQGTFGHILESMEKLGNAICLENGLYQNAKKQSAQSSNTRKTLRLSQLAKKSNGRDMRIN